MPEHLEVEKTWKLFINGAFPRSESGRSIAVSDAKGRVIAQIAHASRKDLRDAVEAARAAQPGWSAMTACNRGQILYRMAEMLQGRRDELAQALGEKSTSQQVNKSTGEPRNRRAATMAQRAATVRERSLEIDATIDRLVCFAGWADKFAQVLGCANPVAGPYYNFTIPEPTGVVGAVASDEPALLGLVSLIAPPLCAGNTIVAIAGEANPLPAVLLGEVCATSDVPAGVVNILTGNRDELLEHLASHRDVNAISAAGLTRPQRAMVQVAAADNVKRVRFLDLAGEQWLDPAACEGPWLIEPFVEFKTIWHPSAT